MSSDSLPHLTSSYGDRPCDRLRVMVVSDHPDFDRGLRNEFNVVVLNFAHVDAELRSLSVDVIVVDAIGTPRLMEVSRIALAGLRGVVVIGDARDPSDAMRYLDIGAADYLSASGSTIEFVARVRAIARTTSLHALDDAMKIGDLTISLRGREIHRAGKVVHLTPNEFAVLEVLAQEPGNVVTHRQLLTTVWGSELADARHYLRLYIRQLREKLEDDPEHPSLIQTEWGAGYRLVVASEQDPERAETA